MWTEAKSPIKKLRINLDLDMCGRGLKNQVLTHGFYCIMCLFFFRGVPAVVDFAAMRDAVKRLGGDPGKINPLCPADLVIDHSVQVDVSRR